MEVSIDFDPVWRFWQKMKLDCQSHSPGVCQNRTRLVIADKNENGGVSDDRTCYLTSATHPNVSLSQVSFVVHA
jgi:hypothetical protein